MIYAYFILFRICSILSRPGARGDEVEEAGPLRLVHLLQLCHQVLVGRRLLAQAAHRVEVVQQRLLVPLDAVLDLCRGGWLIFCVS